MNNIRIISFASNGGIKQFTEYLIKNCFDDVEILNSNSLKEVFLYIKKHKKNSTFLFTTNNLKIFICLFFFNFESILILHDHLLRKNSTLREKIMHYFIFKYINKFKSVIIHQKDEYLLNKYPNIQYLKMPYHNTIKEESSDKKINLLFFGRIEKYKNINILIKSFQNKEIASKFNLIIAGKGNIDNEVIPLLKKPNITVINQFIDDTLRDILIDWSHYFILPYDSITQTGIVDMAGSYKKPSIVSNIDGFQDYYSKIFKNVVNINDQNLFESDLLEIYKDYFLNYKKACEESYLIYEKSNHEWKKYKSFLKKFKR